MSRSLGMAVLAVIGCIKVSANLSPFLIHLLVSMLQNDEFDFALSSSSKSGDVKYTLPQPAWPHHAGRDCDGTLQWPPKQKVRLKYYNRLKHPDIKKSRCFHLSGPQDNPLDGSAWTRRLCNQTARSVILKLIKPCNFLDTNLRVTWNQRPPSFSKGRTHHTWPPTERTGWSQSDSTGF